VSCLRHWFGFDKMYTKVHGPAPSRLNTRTHCLPPPRGEESPKLDRGVPSSRPGPVLCAPDVFSHTLSQRLSHGAPARAPSFRPRTLTVN
jgi:hypothetical protein